MKKLRSTLNFLFLLFTSYIILPAKQSLAVISNPVVNNGVNQATAPQDYFNSVLSAVISIFFLVGIVYYIWHIVFAGYHLISSEGDPKRWESAKLEIIYATVGLFAVFSIFAILKFVGTVLGVTGLENLQIGWPTL
jgi:hypothetical protein